MEQELINKIKRHEISIKELVKELASKRTLTEKTILKTAECISTEKSMIKNYKSILREFFNYS